MFLTREDHRPFHRQQYVPHKDKAKYYIYAVQPDNDMARLAYKDFGSIWSGALNAKPPMQSY